MAEFNALLEGGDGDVLSERQKAQGGDGGAMVRHYERTKGERANARQILMLFPIITK